MSISSRRIFIAVCIFISTWIKELMWENNPFGAVYNSVGQETE